jgi:2,3-bisphosphoglycerate-independent phosphoglycerate mutase
LKYLIILGDGMADRPIASLGGKTPLMAADIPHMDELAKKGRTGLLETLPPDMPPGSDVANLAVLGYEVRKVYQGRGVLEAASLGVRREDTDLAMRCNLICIEHGRIKNHSAGHISTEEAHILIDYLNKEIGSEEYKFHPGVSYRNLLVLKDGVNDINCTPPHDVPGTPFKEVLVKSASEKGIQTAKLLNELILKSQEILPNHPVNLERIRQGKDPANSVWFWSPGYKPQMKTFRELYGLKGAVISAVDLIHGIGAYAGMDSLYVECATGLHDTNYEGKAEKAIEALKTYDFVFLHIEASDEAGHEGDADLKIKTLEYLDKRVVKYIMENISSIDDDVSIALLPDHATPCEVRTHVHDLVPFVIYNPASSPDAVISYDEISVKNGCFGLLRGPEFIEHLLNKKSLDKS